MDVCHVPVSCTDCFECVSVFVRARLSAQAKVHAELDAVLGDRDVASYDDLNRYASV